MLAPCATAARTNASARASLPAVVDAHANCVAATVTRRGDEDRTGTSPVPYGTLFATGPSDCSTALRSTQPLERGGGISDVGEAPLLVVSCREYDSAFSACRARHWATTSACALVHRGTTTPGTSCTPVKCDRMMFGLSDRTQRVDQTRWLILCHSQSVTQSE